ncbi:MAG: hypothetical protein HW416_3208, partial [Chloroflexi bacterium]|nr:hypothetical protein [Chloroflexota bacterium]
MTAPTQEERQPLRNPDGSANTRAIYELPLDALADWLDARLMGRDPYLPLGRSEELPETLIVQLYEDAEPTAPFRERVRQAMRRLLRPALTGAANRPATWLTSALGLAFGVARCEGRNDQPFDFLQSSLLRQAFTSKRFSEGEFGEEAVDGEILALLTIHQDLQPITFWRGLLGNPRYAATAFPAFGRYGVEAAVGTVPAYIQTLRAAVPADRMAAEVVLALRDLIEASGADRVVQLLSETVHDEDWEAARGALHVLGIEVAGGQSPWVVDRSLIPPEQRQQSEATLSPLA